MHHDLGEIRLRKPEAHDVDAMYAWKNDPGVSVFLGGFSTGYTRADLGKWIEFHRSAPDEALYMIARKADDVAVGHVGLYKINPRIRSGEFAILIGDRSAWGKGIGRATSKFMCEFGFDQLNLRRIALELPANNTRAHSLYKSLGFVDEGRLRQAHFKDGAYHDVILMGLFREELVR